MKLYHGSNANFANIDLSKSKSKRDFGKGFYTTTIKEQAEEWGWIILKRYGGECFYLYEFEFEIGNDFNVKKFDEINEGWFDFIIDNRTKDSPHNYDIVIGPVANDKTTRTISNYIEGIYTKEEAMSRLKYNKANNQVSMHTLKALSNLKFLNKKSVSKDKSIFNGQDISFDIIQKSEHVAEILAKVQNASFDEAYKRFIGSKTYCILKDTTTLLWAESAEFILSEFLEEK